MHLELTDSLSTPNFIFAFKRFVGKRGLPAIIYSDNAAIFKAAQKILAHIHLAGSTLRLFHPGGEVGGSASSAQ